MALVGPVGHGPSRDHPAAGAARGGRGARGRAVERATRPVPSGRWYRCAGTSFSAGAAGTGRPIVAIADIAEQCPGAPRRRGVTMIDDASELCVGYDHGARTAHARDSESLMAGPCRTVV